MNDFGLQFVVDITGDAINAVSNDKTIEILLNYTTNPLRSQPIMSKKNCFLTSYDIGFQFIIKNSSNLRISRCYSRRQ